MQPKLDRTELSQRLGRQATDLVVQMASLLQGGALSAAAFSLVNIVQTPEDLAVRLMLWLISVILSIVAFFRLCNRAVTQTRLGLEVLIVLPIMCLLEVVLFAILSTTELGQDGWRAWYIAGAALFLVGSGANALSLRTVKEEEFAEDARYVFVAQSASIRRDCLEGILAAAFTGALGVWLMLMPPDWSFAIFVVSFHLALTVVSAIAILRQSAREFEFLRGA